MTKKALVFSVAAALLLLWLAGGTYAHHGINAWYDVTHTVTVKGTVTSFEWTNPHVYVYFDVKDANGAIQKWRAEMGGVGMLARIGWKKDTVKPGDEITATGKAANDGKPSMLLDKVVLASGQELLGHDVIVPVEGVPTPKE